MNDDLIKELRFWNGGHKSDEKMLRAADRIEKLESALRKIAAHHRYNAEMASLARKALEGKDD